MAALLLVTAVLGLAAQAAGPAASPGADLDAQIGLLGSFDYPTRMNAARAIRRAPAPAAVEALTRAVRAHDDEFVRFRAFVLLTAFGDRGTAALVRWAIGDRNDRLREVAFKWLERHPDPQLAFTLLAALQTEQGEFVRPALVGALAALGDRPDVQRALVAEMPRGMEVFRSAVVDALGRHRAVYAFAPIAALAREDGPLQNDAILALGRLGDSRALPVLRELAGLPRDVQFAARAARCLLGDACADHIGESMRAARTATRPVVRAAVEALAEMGAGGRPEALDALLDLSAEEGFLRDVAGVGLAAAAVRRPGGVIEWLGEAPPHRQSAAIEVLKEGFDRLDEDFGEEHFFAAARASYWKAAEGSAARELAAALIARLEF